MDPPQSNFSGGQVCLPVGTDNRASEITAEVYGPTKAPLDSIALMTRVKRIQSTSLANWFYCLDILLSGLALKRDVERLWNIANTQLAVKSKYHPLFLLCVLPICSSWHMVGLIQIIVRLLRGMLLIIHLCFQCSLKHPRIKPQPMKYIIYKYCLYAMFKNAALRWVLIPFRWLRLELHRPVLSVVSCC